MFMPLAAIPSNRACLHVGIRDDDDNGDGNVGNDARVHAPVKRSFSSCVIVVCVWNSNSI